MPARLSAALRSLGLAALVAAASLIAWQASPLAGSLIAIAGSSLALVRSYRREWRVGAMTCLMPALAVALAYLVQLAELDHPSQITPAFEVRPDPEWLRAALVLGLVVGALRGRALRLRASGRALLAASTSPDLVLWAAAFGLTQSLALAQAYRGFELSLLGGAFSSAMVVATSLVLLGRSRIRRRSPLPAPPAEPLGRGVALGLAFALAAVAAANGQGTLWSGTTAWQETWLDFHKDNGHVLLSGSGELSLAIDFASGQVSGELSGRILTKEPPYEDWPGIDRVQGVASAFAGSYQGDARAGTFSASFVGYPQEAGKVFEIGLHGKLEAGRITGGAPTYLLHEETGQAANITFSFDLGDAVTPGAAAASGTRMEGNEGQAAAEPAGAAAEDAGYQELLARLESGADLDGVLLEAAVRNFGSAAESVTLFAALLLQLAVLGLAVSGANGAAAAADFGRDGIDAEGIDRRGLDDRGPIDREGLLAGIARSQAEASEAISSLAIACDAAGRAGEELADAGRTLRRQAATGLEEAAEAGADVARDPAILLETLQGSLRTVRNGVLHAADAAGDMAGRLGELVRDPEKMRQQAEGLLGAIAATLGDLERVRDLAADLTGYRNFERSLDPARPLLQRLGEVAAGTGKVGGLLQAGAAVRSLGGARGLAGAIDDAAGAGSRPSAGANRAPAGVRGSATIAGAGKAPGAAGKARFDDEMARALRGELDPPAELIGGPMPSHHVEGGSLEAAARFKGGRYVEMDLRTQRVQDVAKMAGEEDRYTPGKVRVWIGDGEDLRADRVTVLRNPNDPAHKGLDLDEIARRALEHERRRRGE